MTIEIEAGASQGQCNMKTVKSAPCLWWKVLEDGKMKRYRTEVGIRMIEKAGFETGFCRYSVRDRTSVLPPRTYLAAVFLTTLVRSQRQFSFILLALSAMNLDQTRSSCEKSPARVQRLIPAADGKLLQANSGEVAEWLNAAVC